jgi:hypothetical protein
MRLAMLATVLALAAVPAHAVESWQTFADPTGVFSIAVPAPMTATNATTTRHDGSVVKVIVYDVRWGEDDELMVRIADFTGEKLAPADAVQMAFNGIAASYTVVSHAPVTLDGHDGQDAVLTDRDGLQYTDRIFFMDDHLYQALTVVPKDATSEQAARAARFSRSLRFFR